MTLPLLYSEAFARLLAGERRYCRCEDPSWDIEPDRGRCRVCGLEVHPAAVRREQAIALEWADDHRRVAA